MEEDSRGQSKDEMKLFIGAIRDALVVLRGLLVATLAILITLFETVSRYISEARSSPDSSDIAMDHPKEIIEENPIYSTQTSSNDSLPKMTQENQINRYFYPILALISTLSFVTGVTMIRPISQWAGSQVECVEKTLRENDIDLQKSVKICNGGHD